MLQKTLSVDQGATVDILSIPGDLRVAGWDRSEIMAKTDGDELQLQETGEDIQAGCDGDLILYIPRQSTLNIRNVSGDASLQAVEGPIRVGPIAGDLTMHGVGPVNLETVAGDADLRQIGAVTAKSISGGFTLRGGSGPCAIETISGDASIRDVKGEVAIQNVGSDIYIRHVQGSVNVNAGADVALYLDPQPGQIYTATAGDDIIVRLPPDVNVHLNLVGTNPDQIQVNIPGVEFQGGSTSYDLTVGQESENIARMSLTAGDDLLVTCKADAWESAADFGVGMNDGSNWTIPTIPPIPPLPPDFSERINRRVQAAMERAQSHIESAGRRAEYAGRKVEAAVRRAEAKARAAEVRARRGQMNMNLKVGRWEWDLAPQGEEESPQPATDEERLAILRMLQEKRISLEDAEKLLAALEGR